MKPPCCLAFMSWSPRTPTTGGSGTPAHHRDRHLDASERRRSREVPQAFATAYGSNIPVIAVTANSGEFMKQHRDKGFVTHLFKPADPSELCGAVATAYAGGEK